MKSAQESVLRIFMESGAYSSSHVNDYRLRAHCGAYKRMRM